MSPRSKLAASTLEAKKRTRHRVLGPLKKKTTCSLTILKRSFFKKRVFQLLKGPLLSLPHWLPSTSSVHHWAEAWAERGVSDLCNSCNGGDTQCKPVWCSQDSFPVCIHSWTTSVPTVLLGGFFPVFLWGLQCRSDLSSGADRDACLLGSTFHKIFRPTPTGMESVRDTEQFLRSVERTRAKSQNANCFHGNERPSRLETKGLKNGHDAVDSRLAGPKISWRTRSSAEWDACGAENERLHRFRPGRGFGAALLLQGVVTPPILTPPLATGRARREAGLTAGSL